MSAPRRQGDRALQQQRRLEKVCAPRSQLRRVQELNVHTLSSNALNQCSP